MSDKLSEFESFQPVVGRIKSKRWVTDSTNRYDGDEWGDRYNDYSGDEQEEEGEEEIPPVPTVPDLPELASDKTDAEQTPSKVPSTLVLGTQAESATSVAQATHTDATESSVAPGSVAPGAMLPEQTEHTEQTEQTEQAEPHTTDKEKHSNEAPAVVTTRYGTQMPVIITNSGSPEDAPPTSTAPDSGYPEDIYGYYQDESEAVMDSKIAAASKSVPETVPESVPETVPEFVHETVPEPVHETVLETVPESVPESVPETSTENTANSLHATEPNGSKPSDSESDSDVAAPPRGRWQPIETRTETDHTVDTAPLATKEKSGNNVETVGAGVAALSIDTDAKPVENHGSEETEPETASGTPVTVLTREILGTFSEEDASHSNRLKRDESSGNLDDPELAALYASSSQFLTRPLSQYDYSNLSNTEPLSPRKTQDEFDTTDLKEAVPAEQETQRALPAEGVSDAPLLDLPRIDEVLPSLPNKEGTLPGSEASVGGSSKPSSEQFRDFDSDFSSQVPPPPQPRTEPLGAYDSSLESHSDIRGLTSPDNTNSDIDAAEVQSIATGYSTGSVIRPDSSMATRDAEAVAPTPTEPLPSSTAHNVGGSPLNARATSGLISQRLNRPPAFDFTGILSKPRAADRVLAFNIAVDKELAYNPGLDAWLEYAKESAPKLGIYTSGKPPPPTQSEARLAVPSRTVSTTLIRPAKHISKEAFGKAGEKSTKTAKALFAKGRKFIKTQPS